MAYRLLKEIIAGRDVEKMKCSEATQIVNEFFIRWMSSTLGVRNDKVDYLATRALQKAGLGCFA